MSRQRTAPGAAMAAAWFLLAQPVFSQGRPLTLQDMMKFRAIDHPSIARDGSSVAYTLRPDRGDAEVVVRSTAGAPARGIPRATAPFLSNDGRWLSARIRPSAAELEKAGRNASKLKDTAVVMDLAGGDTVCVPSPERSAFSEDSRWFVCLAGTPPRGELLLRDLRTGSWSRFASAASFALDSLSRWLAWSVEDFARTNGVMLLDLTAPGSTPRPIHSRPAVKISHAVWSTRDPALAFVSAPADSAGKTSPGELFLWRPGMDSASAAAGGANLPARWIVPSKNELAWSSDGRSLFFGVRPASDTVSARRNPPDTGAVSLFDVEALREKRELDIWHSDDALIQPHQRKSFRTDRDRVYRAVVGAEGRVTVLADSSVPEVAVPGNMRRALGSSGLAYRKEITWDGEYRDWFMVDLATGNRTKFLGRHEDAVSLSPDGRRAAYFRDRAWFVYDAETGATVNMTRGVTTAFHDEEHDRPEPPPAYGMAGWADGGNTLLVYDRFDLWGLPAGGGAAVNLTRGEGRRLGYRLRVVALAPRPDAWSTGDTLYLSAFHDRNKNLAVFRTVLGTPGALPLAEGSRRVSLVARARGSGALLYRSESYTEFPDLWTADGAMGRAQRMSDANPQTAEFAWGSAELVEWNGDDGKPLQGVLIRPGNYVPGRKYPVLVYFYETMSDRLHAFNEVVVNHRPCFPFYASNGYAVFLPDVRYTVGRPGASAVRCVVPGVKKLIAMGVADPKAVALHGHSWGGYETAFIVTQTDIFAAAIAGAPVGNMVSAYSGLRRGQGVARQFQYEQEQSRIGGTLWQKRDLYIENSPVFFADRITTPLLIQHGDEDEAVPWEQAIEMHLALRRLGKPSILLQYRGEPHHLKKYPNKVDYTLRMKEYLDHYCKGVPPADWISRGEPYRE